MSPGLARSAAKARHDPTRPCTSLAPHLAGERVWHQLWHVPRPTAPGSAGQTVDDLQQDVAAWRATTRLNTSVMLAAADGSTPFNGTADC